MTGNMYLPVWFGRCPTVFVHNVLLVSFVVSFGTCTNTVAQSTADADPAATGTGSAGTPTGSAAEDGRHRTVNDEREATGGKINITDLEMYRALFTGKRAAHRAAVKNLLSMTDYEKQYAMIKLVLEKMFKVLTDSKVELMEKGFAPGDPFPSEESVRDDLASSTVQAVVDFFEDDEVSRVMPGKKDFVSVRIDALSRVAENTIFFGDIVLHLPDITHDILRRKHEWELTLQWSVGFCDDTHIYDSNDQQVLHLMAQELNIVEKDTDYINPYKKATTHNQFEKELQDLVKLKEQKQKDKQKERKKKKHRGPRLSGSRHAEL